MTFAQAKKLVGTGNGRDLSRREKRLISVLGLPTFGLALAITVVVTYAPLLAKQYTKSAAIVGTIIATEGIVALILPVLAGSVSDHLRTRLGGRLPFVIAGTPLAVIALLLIGWAGSIAAIIVYLTLFFIAYYLAYEPYRALYPDVVDDKIAGRAQSAQALWRGAGTGIALAVCGYLFAIQKWLPFVVSAFGLLASTAVFLYILLKWYGVPAQHRREPDSLGQAYRQTLGLLKNNRSIRNFFVANTLWELSLGALKSFILLYLTIGLGKSKTEAATILGVGAVIIFLAAPLCGKLADTYGKVRVMRLAIIIFGVGLLVPLFTTATWLGFVIMPAVAFGGAVVLTLPYALLMPMMPKGNHGRITGLYSTSRGLGIMLGPLLAGAAISIGDDFFLAGGYSGMWLVCAVSMLISLPFLLGIDTETA
jgi:MFS family permease